MPFVETDILQTPLGLPDAIDVNPDRPEIDTSAGAVIGAAFRRENPVVSNYSSYDYDPTLQFDPDYSPWDDIEGTIYQDYAESFYGAHNADEVAQMKAQIDREREDAATLQAAGGWGFLAEMAAAVLSPTSLLPGGAVVKSAQGINIGRSAASVSLSAAVAAGIDEGFLHSTQEIRTGTESAFAIGGSVILGGLLGTGAGALGRRSQMRTSEQIEQLPEAILEVNDALRAYNESTAGAQQVRGTAGDMELRKAKLFETLNSIPVLRGLVRTDPLLRAQLSSNVEVRRALVGLSETVLEYGENSVGRSVMDHVVGRVSAETAVKTRRNLDLGQSMRGLSDLYGNYVKDGPVGMVGRFTAPLIGKYQHLAGLDRKLGMDQFMQEVGLAMRNGDEHAIPQVQQAAQMLRSRIFDKARDDMIDIGVWDESLQLQNGDSYLTRVFNREVIEAHAKDGSDLDLHAVLKNEFQKTRAESQRRLAEDPTVRNLQNDVAGLKESIRGQQTALKRAEKKAKAKKSRAQSAITRENAVSRASTALRRLFERRSDDLSQKTLVGAEKAEFAEMVRMARNPDRLEPPDIFKAIHHLGGIKDDGSGELAAAVDQRILSVRRSDGLDVDYMREALVESGYLEEGVTIDEFYTILREANNGEKVYSFMESRAEIEAYESAVQLRDTFDEMGVDISKSIDEILNDIPGYARNQQTARAKAKEAGRSATVSGKKASAAQVRVLKAMERLEDANTRLAELDEVVGPKVRGAVRAERESLSKTIADLKKSKKTQSRDEYYASKDDADLDIDVDDAVNSILGLKEGQHSFQATLSNPTRARTLDVSDEVLLPFLENDAGVIMNQYFHSVVPHIEIARRFGDVNMTDAINDIVKEKDRLVANSKTKKERTAHVNEAKNRIRELKAMRDRIMGTYGVPNDPRNAWVIGGRTMRTLSYTGYLGGMTLAAVPDIGGVVGRNGLEAAFGATTALTDPKRMGIALTDAMEDFASASDWYLNGRAMTMAEVADPYGANSRFERGLGKVSHAFTTATGMTMWNSGWKTISTALTASRVSKAAMASLEGNATPSQLRKLAANGIDPAMAERVARQLKQFGDMDGRLWLPQGSKWSDAEAFEAFQHAMTREMDIAVITPGQDVPLSFSGEFGKLFSQFKTFTASAHHRILLSGLQRSDAEVLAQVTIAILLGGLVSNIKADLGGHDRKEGSAFWVDAIDRAGLGGWLFEAHNIANTVSGGRLGEEVSRYKSRNLVGALAGPSFGMATDFISGVSAISNPEVNHSYKDTHKAMRLIPGSNLPYLMWLFKSVEDGVTDMTGGKARPEN